MNIPKQLQKLAFGIARNLPQLKDFSGKIGLLLLMSAVFLTSSLYASNKEMASQEESNLPEILYSKILETIKYSESIPGLDFESFLSLKLQIPRTWNTLTRESILEVRGSDKDIRPHFVAFQVVIEHVLASLLGKDIPSVLGIIHTPMPATPLCSKGEISDGLVDSSFELDPARLFTVKARTTILRDYLAKGESYILSIQKADYLNAQSRNKKFISKNC